MCGKSDLQAYLTVLLETDLDGNPFWLHTNPMAEDQATVEFYACRNCLEQFGKWEDAIKHTQEDNKNVKSQEV